MAVTHAEWCERFDSGLREFHHLRNLADKDKYKLTKLSTELEAYKGPSINDVTLGRGGGGLPKCDKHY